MTISLEETLLEVRRGFRDVSWSNSTLKAWIKDGVRDYSSSFPASAEFSDQAEDGVFCYDFYPGAHSDEDLPVIFGVISFEYPTGQKPPSYPRRLSHTASRFFSLSSFCYDIVLNPSTNNAEIWLSRPKTGAQFQVKYLTAHTWTPLEDGSDETCELPAHHRPILVQYVSWQCWREILGRPHTEFSILPLRLLEKRVEIERSHYNALIHLHKLARPSESQAVTWKMDKYDGTY